MKKPILTLIFSITFGFSIFAGNTSKMGNLLEESFVNDIPFNTFAIYNSVMESRNKLSLRLPEEAMVNDIPFDTKKIFNQTMSKIYQFQKLKEESLVDDIPFNTADVVKNLK